LQGLDSRRAVITGQSPEVRLRAEQPVPSAQIVGGTRKAANAFGQEQMRFVAAATLPVVSSWTASIITKVKIVSFNPSYGRVVASTSCALIRIRLPLRRTLPSRA
jgi:hypothetical protein